MKWLLLLCVAIAGCSEPYLNNKTEISALKTELSEIENEFKNISVRKTTDIVSMGKLDQKIRNFQIKLSRFKTSPLETDKIQRDADLLLSQIDHQNIEKLLELKPQNHWFKKSDIGEDGALYAFLIIQHAPAEIQNRYFKELEQAALSKDIKPNHFAMFYDRVKVGRGEMQKYGTQFQCLDGQLTEFPILDRINLNNFRKVAEFQETFEEYSKLIKENSACK